ncbi:uncharacterized protein LOC9660553 [Selaginella moellendorffii]|uniref:uncharacterized protein LOC9660553 n=1 Tax=Selaginella moellendorffii TaxID=88036 RepID=UPI000D1C4A17|nr:uncharacterized protein LOC9660553 [Selaginella moellendorffii]|eukprot:XP_024520476.1 uncharacterized protein LOC9660553 [Selaginella moellendorffii]
MGMEREHTPLLAYKIPTRTRQFLTSGWIGLVQNFLVLASQIPKMTACYSTSKMFKRLALWILFVVLLILSWRPVFDLWSNELDRTINADLDSNIRAVMKFAGPHLQDCKHCSAMNSKFDHDSTSTREFPAWINGAEEDNLPFTRRVQRDIWLHQHPRNCSDAKFLAHWHETSSSVGVGSDMVSMAGMLGAAIIENRFLITHGAKHKGCAGSSHGRWSCYFVPEASEECITRALQLSMQEEARREGIVKDFSGDQWNLVPSSWGEPWKAMQPTVELDGKLVNHNANHRRWWRAQASL